MITSSFPCDMELLKTLIYVYELSMDNKFVLGLCIIGFGILLLFSRADYSIWFSAIAVGIGSGIIITKKDKKED